MREHIQLCLMNHSFPALTCKWKAIGDNVRSRLRDATITMQFLTFRFIFIKIIKQELCLLLYLEDLGSISSTCKVVQN